LYNAYDLHTVLLKGRVHAKGAGTPLFLITKHPITDRRYNTCDKNYY